MGWSLVACRLFSIADIVNNMYSIENTSFCGDVYLGREIDKEKMETTVADSETLLGFLSANFLAEKIDYIICALRSPSI